MGLIIVCAVDTTKDPCLDSKLERDKNEYKGATVDVQVRSAGPLD